MHVRMSKCECLTRWRSGPSSIRKVSRSETSISRRARANASGGWNFNRNASGRRARKDDANKSLHMHITGRCRIETRARLDFLEASLAFGAGGGGPRIRSISISIVCYKVDEILWSNTFLKNSVNIC